MKEDYVVYKARIRTFQMTVLVIMVFVMVIGGCIFGLGVKTRPILRITRPETFHHVKWILDMMIATGMAQLATAGFDCFATCWKHMWPLYLGIGLTALTVCLELTSIGTSLHLLHSADELANEEIFHPWYWVECEVTAGCHAALLNYVYYFVMPQVALSALAIFLQCLGILAMGRMVKTVEEYRKTKAAYKVWYREHHGDGDGVGQVPAPVRGQGQVDTKTNPEIIPSTSTSIKSRMTSSMKSKAASPVQAGSGIEMTPMKQQKKVRILEVAEVHEVEKS